MRARLTVGGKTITRQPIRHAAKQSGLCGLTQCLPCCVELSCQWLCDEMSYLAARVPIPSNLPTLPSVLNTPLHCLPQKQAVRLDGSTLAKVEKKGAIEGQWEKKGLIPPSRTWNLANGTPLKKPPRGESAPPKGSSSLPTVAMQAGV